MEASILTSVKKVLGLSADYTAFDEDVIMHTNSVLSILTQLGVGPEDGFFISDDTTEWSEFIADDNQLNSVKTYVSLRVRMLFDPPQTSYLIGAMEKQISELEYRLNVHREETEWVDPDPPVVEEVP